MVELHQLKTAVKNFFTPRQLKHLENSTKHAVWSVEEIFQGIAINGAGAKAYCLFKKKEYPLPAISTIRAWTKKKNKVVPGILYPVLYLIKKFDLTQWEKVCVLSFHEMKIRRVNAYDKVTDELLKPSNYAQVPSIRRLLASWKQQIFFDYDRKMDKPLLFKIIEAIEGAGF